MARELTEAEKKSIAAAQKRYAKILARRKAAKVKKAPPAKKQRKITQKLFSSSTDRMKEYGID